MSIRLEQLINDVDSSSDNDLLFGDTISIKGRKFVPVVRVTAQGMLFRPGNVGTISGICNPIAVIEITAFHVTVHLLEGIRCRAKFELSLTSNFPSD